MKKVFVLLSAVLVAGCFVCRKGEPKAKPVKQEPQVVEQPKVEQQPVQKPQVVVAPKPGEVVYSMPGVAHFAFNSTEAEPDLNKVGLLGYEIQSYPDAIVVVQGHTDNIGSETYNKKLSTKRAEVMAEQLKESGITNPVRIEGDCYFSPIASNDTAEGRAKNRRVDVVLIRE